MTAERRHYLSALAAILAFAFALRIFVAITMPNILWPDEIFQSMEQGHRFAFGYGLIPWEFRAGSRSWMLPGLLGVIMKATSWFSGTVGAYLMTCASALTLISLAPVWGAFKLAFREAGLRGAIIAGLFVALWFEMIFFAPKALSEGVAGNLLALGIVVGILIKDGETIPTRRSVIVFAAALAFASMFRIQLSVAAFTVFVIVGLTLPRQLRIVAIATGAAVVLGAGLLDWITWDYPFQSYVENIRINIVEDKSSTYGIAPWYAYFEVYGRLWAWWAIPILGLAVLGAKRAPLLGLGVLLVLLVHVPVAHKEYRFAYPAMVLVVILAGLGAASVIRWCEQQRGARLATIAAAGLVAAWFAASTAGASGFHGNKTQLASLWAPEENHWERRRGGLLALERLSSHPEICGVGLAAVGWGDTGGYTYLHRDIPLFPFPKQDTLWEFLPHFNALITKPGKPETIGPFARDRCWVDVCLYVRAGPCVPRRDFQLNDILEYNGG